MVSFARQDLLTNLDRITGQVTDFIRGNPIVSTAAIGIGTTGLIAGATTLFRRRKKKKATARRKKSRKKSNGRKRKTVRGRTGKRRKFGLRKAVRSKRIRVTKNGQPYIILKSGKARFIKKSSARLARKRKGGFS